MRFVEGEYRTNRLKNMYPNDNFVNVGFCKLDPIINGETTGFDLNQPRLKNRKKDINLCSYFLP